MPKKTVVFKGFLLLCLLTTFGAGSATALARRGISKVGPNALKIGEELTVRFTPARNGSPLGGLKEIERADGQILGNEGGN